MNTDHLDLGKAGEKEAEMFLCQKGYVVVDRNFRKPFGEIDLIMQDKSCLVFVEVRTKTDPEEVHPFETITPIKKQRIIRTAMAYLKEKGQYDVLCRFDVMAMTPVGMNKWEMEHLEQAFEVASFS